MGGKRRQPSRYPKSSKYLRQRRYQDGDGFSQSVAIVWWRGPCGHFCHTLFTRNASQDNIRTSWSLNSAGSVQKPNKLSNNDVAPLQFGVFPKGRQLRQQRPSVVQKRNNWPDWVREKPNFAELSVSFCHAGHTGSVDPAAKGCTDDLKSSKSNRGPRRPTSQESSITNQRRMLRVSFGWWKPHWARCLRGLRGMSFLVVVLDALVQALKMFLGKCCCVLKGSKNTHVTLTDSVAKETVQHICF